jgi:DNA-binding CsgD family transcriptional regulator
MSMVLHVHENWVAVKSSPPIVPGEIFYDPEMGIATERDDREFAERLATLTLREHEMLRLRAQGLTNPDIAARCFLSEQTVKNHLYHAVRKLVLDGIDERAKLNRALYLLGRFEGRDTAG